MTDRDRYLVTGGTGFIGSFIVNRLVDLDKDVTVIANSDRNSWRIEDLERVDLRCVDITQYDQLTRTVQEIRPTFIVHLAAYVDPSRNISTIDRIQSVNLDGTLNLLRATSDIPYKLFINTGTCEEYGLRTSPFTEEQKERPVSPYSFSKTASTYLASLFSDTYNARIVTVRPFLTYGPKQLSRRVIPSLIRAGVKRESISLTPGEQTRDFIYVEDVIDAYLAIAKNYKLFSEHEILNVGTGYEVQIKTVVEEISKHFPEASYNLGELAYREGETMHFYASIDKIKSLVNWQPMWNLSEGLKETIEWWKQNPQRWDQRDTNG